MDVLTRERAKPTLPFAGVFRLIDFPLSNLANSGLTDVWLSVQYHGASLGEQVANGRPWDLDRNRGGLRLLMPEEGTGGTDEEGFAKGNADELYRIRDQVRAHRRRPARRLQRRPRLPVRRADAVATHRRAGADCTVVTATVPIAEASDHATVEADGDGRVTAFAYKPERADDRDRGRRDLRVRRGRARPGPRGAAPRAGRRGRGGRHRAGRLRRPPAAPAGRPAARSWRTRCRATGRTSASRTSTSPPTTTCCSATSVCSTTRTGRSSASRPSGPRPACPTVPGWRTACSAPAATVRGTVIRSVHRAGRASSRRAPWCATAWSSRTPVVEEGARLDWAVVDRDCVVGANAEVGSPDADPDDSDEIVLIGRGSRLAPGTVLDRGARLEPGTTT